jgi:RNA polymerase sigma-70 factor (ECF subfamily)
LPPADEELMTLFTAKGDESAFRGLAGRHTARMYRIACAMLGSSRDAEDAVQECFMRIVRMRHSYKRDTAFAPWAYTILRHYCIDEIRRRQGRRLEQLDPETLAAPEKTGLGAEENETLQAVHEALRKLDEIGRIAVSLRIYGELSFAEIAETCRTTEDAAKKRFYRALEELKSSLSLFA